MKKLILSFLSLCSLNQVFGLNYGNPSNPEMIDTGFFLARDNCFGVKAAFQRDTVLDRKMKVINHVSHHKMDGFSYVMDQGILTLNFADRYEVYGSTGSFKSIFSNRPTLAGPFLEYETKTHITWGAGGRATVFEWGKTDLNIDAKFQYAHPVLDWVTDNGALAGSKSNSGHMRFREWQIGLGLAHQVDIFIPYLAGYYVNNSTKVSGLPAVLPENRTHLKMKNQHKFGMALGCGLTTNKLFSLNVETRIIDETALTLTGEIKF